MRLLHALFIQAFLATGLALFAALSHRVEIGDGVQALFHMLNGMPYQNYINSRTLGQITQFTAYFNNPLLALGASYQTLSTLHQVSLAFFPLLLLLINARLCFKLQKDEWLPYLLLTYTLAILPTAPFAISLVPEAVMLFWTSFLLWSPTARLRQALASCLFLIVAGLGHESILVLNVLLLAFVFWELYRLGWGTLTYPTKLYALSALLVLIYRVTTIEQAGFFLSSALDMLRYPGPFHYVVAMALVLVLVAHAPTGWQKFFPKLFALCAVVAITLTAIHLSQFRSELPRMSYSGFHYRSLTFFISALLLVLCYFFRTKASSTRLLGINFSALIVVTLVDLFCTIGWAKHRTQERAFYEQFPLGCHQRAGLDDFSAYKSVIYQNSFDIDRIVFPIQPKNVCEKLANRDAKTKPWGLIQDPINNFTFRFYHP